MLKPRWLTLVGVICVLPDALCFALDPPIQDAPDTCITCFHSTIRAQAEPSVTIKSTDPNVILVTSNTWPDANYLVQLGTVASISTDGGRTWTVQEGATGGPNFGDPASAILANGTFISGYILNQVSGLAGIGAAFSTNFGSTWNARTVASAESLDRPDLWTDSIDPQHRIYVGWSDLSSTVPFHRISVAISSNSGESYSSLPTEISDAGNLEQDFCVSLRSGPGPTLGQSYVYATWAVFTAQPRRDEKALGLRRTRNQGLDWDLPTSGNPPIRIASVGSPPTPLYVRGTDLTKLADQAKYVSRALYMAPSMAVDQITGAIYIVWTNRGNPLVPPSDSNDPSCGPNDRNIYLIKSTDYGVTWTLPAGLLAPCNGQPVAASVNQDPSGASPLADQWFPRIAMDQETGSLVVLYYDTRNHDYRPPPQPDDHTADVYMSVSRDGGGTWEDFKVSDGSGVYDPRQANPGHDYIGLAASHGRAYAVWADDRVTRGHLRLYVSRILLWGIRQSSVAATAVPTGGTMQVTATWTTNMDAPSGDQINLTSPNGQQYTSQLCTNCGSTSHTLVFSNVPCEPGMWTFTAKSKEQFGTERQSAPGSFFVTPIVAPFALMKPKLGTYATCPAGDGAHFDVSIDFGGSCVSHVASNRLTLQALPVPSPLNRVMAFFPQGVPQPADSAATAGNGYFTTITEKQIGGCDADSATVYLDGVAITKVDVPPNASVDLNGDGGVDSSDLALWSATYGECEDDPDWDPCADLARNVDPTVLKCNDSSDLSMLVSHLSHHWSSPRSKSGVVGSEVTKLIFIGDPEGSRVQAMVRFEGLKGRTAACAILRPNATKLQFEGWLQSAALTKAVFAVSGVDAEGPRVTILAPDVVPDASGNVELGTLSFTLSSADVATGDIAISYEDATSYDAMALQSTQDTSPSERSSPSVSRLDSTYPNPFNPTTTIQYTLARPGHARLVIHSVAGRRVRALVDAWQAEGTYTTVWDGRDDMGRQVGSGIYVSRLTAVDFNGTKKLVVIR